MSDSKGSPAFEKLIKLIEEIRETPYDLREPYKVQFFDAIFDWWQEDLSGKDAVVD